MNATTGELHSKTESSFPANPRIGPDQPAISTYDLSMSFGRAHALHNLNLEIPQSAIYALVGPNGAGKSTLIKLLLNIIRPTSGTASVLGLPSSHIVGEAFARIGYVSENQELPDWMTVHQLLRYLRPFYPLWDTALEAQLVSQFNLPSDRKLKNLSRGQRMKAALLSVLPYRPSLIVLDEPFSGLDPLVRDELIESLLDRAAQDSNPPTILISSHDLAEIETLASHIGYLDNGHLLFSEDISTLTSRFREVTLTLEPTLSAPILPDADNRSDTIQPAPFQTAAYPASWLLPEVGVSIIRFIHSHADTEPLREQIVARYPNTTDIQLEPMSLRSIFLALAKSSRPAAANRSRA
jgi:ABC-2 type transport system ATP-binding protein